MHAEDAFHVYGTSASYCGQEGCHQYRVPRFTGPSLARSGSLQGDAMPLRPAWVASDEPNIWAPSVAQIADTYVMYFSATAGPGHHHGTKCLGFAVAPSPTSPFVPLPEPLHCRAAAWSIDPYVVSDGSGWFLLWRQDDTAHHTGKIVVARLDRHGLAIAGPERTLLVGEHPWEDGHPNDGPGPEQIGPIENPALARHPATGEWLLTWSANRWETASYATGLATCADPLGPCDRLSTWTPWSRTSCDQGVATTTSIVGMGGLSFVTGPDARLYAVLHGYRSSSCDGAPISDRLGWAFVVQPADGTPANEAERYRLVSP
jgi:hypothetical protein